MPVLPLACDTAASVVPLTAECLHEAGGAAVSRDTRDQAGGAQGVQVALLGLPAALGRALVVALTAVGYAVLAPLDVPAWVREDDEHKLVVTTDSHEQLGMLDRLHADAPGLPSVVLLSGSDAACYGAALQRCTAAVPADGPTDDVLLAVQAARSGYTPVPVPLARELAGQVGLGGRPLGPAPQLTAGQLSWLRSLAAGASTARLAQQTGRADREMARLLSGLYAQLGARTRTEALLHAARLGLLDDDVSVRRAPRPP